MLHCMDYVESEAAVIRLVLDAAGKATAQQHTAAHAALDSLEARVEVELELRKAAYERIAALDARPAEVEHALRDVRSVPSVNEAAALIMARKLVERDATTPDSVRHIEVGRGGLILLAKTALALEDRLAEAGREGDAWARESRKAVRLAVRQTQEAEARLAEAKRALRWMATEWAKYADDTPGGHPELIQSGIDMALESARRTVLPPESAEGTRVRVEYFAPEDDHGA